MNEPIYVAVICEGKTEQIFVEWILAPYFQHRCIYLAATQLSKPGEKGGDVKYDRLCNDLKNLLNQSHWKMVTTFFDFYGLKGKWPQYEEAQSFTEAKHKQASLSSAVKESVEAKFSSQEATTRFLPNFIMHETEALYFSAPQVMAENLSIDIKQIQAILEECGAPESINHQRDTSPSHRIETLVGRSFRKTTEGIAIAQAIGLDQMRRKCPLFDQWLSQIEALRCGSTE